MLIGDTMKVLTIKQPYATLIAEGIKKYEFRTWKTKYRGEILIHAGKGTDQKAMEKYKYLNLVYPTGCIIAKATITDCLKIDDTVRKILLSENSIIYSNIIKHTEWNGYGFKLENVKKIKPIPISGKLSFWEFDYQQNCGKGNDE